MDPIEAYADAINEFTQFTLGGEQGRFVLTSDASGRRRYLQRINRGTRGPIEMWQEKPHEPSLFTIHPVPLE